MTDPFLASITTFFNSNTTLNPPEIEEVKRPRGRPRKIHIPDAGTNAFRNELSDEYVPRINSLSDQEILEIKQRYKTLRNLDQPIKETIELVTKHTLLNYKEAYQLCEG